MQVPCEQQVKKAKIEMYLPTYASCSLRKYIIYIIYIIYMCGIQCLSIYTVFIGYASCIIFHRLSCIFIKILQQFVVEMRDVLHIYTYADICRCM